MVIDERIVVAGSFNYTEPANEYNDENIFVMGSTHAEVEGVEVEANPCRELARLSEAGDRTDHLAEQDVRPRLIGPD